GLADDRAAADGVDEDVDASVVLHGAPHDTVDLPCVERVGHDRMRGAAVRAHGARRLVERGLVGVHQNDDTTFAPDDLSRRASDATSACADECDTSLESHGGGVYRTRAGDRRTQMDIPDDWGLEGKVALVSGGGAIGNVSSISALRPRGLTAYTASKGAVIALTRAMAVDHGGEGIRVNCVAPGPVYTPMVYAGGMSPAARETRKNASVLKQEGTGWDIGHAVRFLLSDYARYITGHTLVVDGGTTITGPERDSR